VFVARAAASPGLHAAGFEFCDRGPESAGEARFVVSWTSGGDVPALVRRARPPS